MAEINSGFIFPATGQNGSNNPDRTAGTSPQWDNPGNITATAGVSRFDFGELGSPGTLVIGSDTYLQSRSYDFSSLPSATPIHGIEIRFEYTLTKVIENANVEYTLEINRVSLLQADALSGTEKDSGVSLGPAGGTSENDTKILGGYGDLWSSGITSTDDIKSDAGFGFGIGAKATIDISSSDDFGFNIDIHSHELKIYYGGNVKVWTGAAFEVKGVKYYDGANFSETKAVRRYNGSSFDVID